MPDTVLPQVRRLVFNDEEIGMGFNSQTGLAVGSALDNFTIQDNVVAGGMEVSSSISIVSTHDEMQETLGMSFEAEGRYGLVSGSMKADFAKKTNFNSNSTFVVASVVARNALRRGKDFKVREDVKPLLLPGRVKEFKNAFGDSFVRGLETGGEFYAVVRITSVSTSKQEELAAALQAAYNGLGASGDFKAKFETANNEQHLKTEFTATMYQRAGSGATISPTVSIDEVVERFKKFPEIVKADPVAYETEVATYDTIPLPIPAPLEQEAFVAALGDARDKMLRYIELKNNLELAVRFPEFFIDPPAPATLQEAANTYTKLANAVTQHAVRLSRGQIDPPALFDPTVLSPPLTEPAPIPLKKKDQKVPLEGDVHTVTADSFEGSWTSTDVEAGNITTVIDVVGSFITMEKKQGNHRVLDPVEGNFHADRSSITFSFETKNIFGGKVHTDAEYLMDKADVTTILESNHSVVTQSDGHTIPLNSTIHWHKT